MQDLFPKLLFLPCAGKGELDIENLFEKIIQSPRVTSGETVQIFLKFMLIQVTAHKGTIFEANLNYFMLILPFLMFPHDNTEVGRSQSQHLTNPGQFF